MAPGEEGSGDGRGRDGSDCRQNMLITNKTLRQTKQKC